MTTQYEKDTMLVKLNDFIDYRCGDKKKPPSSSNFKIQKEGYFGGEEVIEHLDHGQARRMVGYGFIVKSYADQTRPKLKPRQAKLPQQIRIEDR